MGPAMSASVTHGETTRPPEPAMMTNPIPAVKLLLDGKFVDSRTSEWHDVVNPATQEVLAQVPFATDDEINAAVASAKRSEEHTSELQSHLNLVCRLLLEKKKKKKNKDYACHNVSTTAT